METVSQSRDATIVLTINNWILSVSMRPDRGLVERMTGFNLNLI